MASPGTSTGGESRPADPASQAWLGLQRLMFVRFRPRMVKIWRDLDLGPPHQMVMRMLDEPRPMGEIAHHLHCDNSHMTGIVDRLEQRGFVERRADPTDRRVRLVALTDRGEAVREQLAEQMAEPPAEFENLSTDELDALVATIDKLTAELPDELEASAGSLPFRRWT